MRPSRISLARSSSENPAQKPRSVKSGAAATVLAAMLGEDFAFDDETHVDDDLPVRRFPSFAAAAEEAAVSRLYGGIHFRFGNEAGLAQGRRVGAYAAALRTEA